MPPGRVDEVIRTGADSERCARSLAALRSAVVRLHEALEREREAELYLRADLENYARRLEREADESARRRLEPLMAEMVEVLDELDIYREAVRASGAGKPVLDGLDMIVGKLLRALAGSGLRQIDPTGEVFDPRFHSAVGVERVRGDSVGRVVGVVRKGYMFGGNVLRPALVRVGISDEG